MENMIYIIGPPAVGKASVGKALADITGYKLAHNHTTIELVYQFLDWSDEEFIPLNVALREVLYEYLKGSRLPGLISTICIAFNLESDVKYLDNLLAKSQQDGLKTCLIELEADYEIRKIRNVQESRLNMKPSKRDLFDMDQFLEDQDMDYRCNSLDGEVTYKNYLKLNNSYMSAEEAAIKIKKYFNI